ncbi:MAG: nucleoside triphosphate pyrophosphohydrolase, partial [Pseudomonadota bacterium]
NMLVVVTWCTELRETAPVASDECSLEEAFEVADAIEREDTDALKDELGDLLFQVVLHSQMAKDSGVFEFEDVAKTIAEKMVKRHPHVFEDRDFATIDEQKLDWESQKRAEREARQEGTLAGVSVSMPALSRSTKLQKRAASVGFDWPDIGGVTDKVKEELRELQEALEQGTNHDHMEEELGDVLFSLVNLSRWLKIDAESALRRANIKFEQRFKHMESHSQQSLHELDIQALETLWQSAKKDSARDP